MLISEIIKEEESNLQNIFFHKEGLFWRAYEHSAYQVVTHLRELKVIKKCFLIILMYLKHYKTLVTAPAATGDGQGLTQARSSGGEPLPLPGLEHP